MAVQVHGADSCPNGSPGAKRKERERQLSELLDGGTRDLDLWGTSCLRQVQQVKSRGSCGPCPSHHQSEHRRRGCPPSSWFAGPARGREGFHAPAGFPPEARGLQCWVAVLILPAGAISEGSCCFFMTLWSLDHRRLPPGQEESMAETPTPSPPPDPKQKLLFQSHIMPVMTYFVSLARPWYSAFDQIPTEVLL